jgi:hypothetical protein
MAARQDQAMTKREVANLCCRVLAVYALIQAIQVGGSMLSMVAQVIIGPFEPYVAGRYAVAMIAPAGLTILAVLMWRKSGIIAAWMVGQDLQDEQHEPEAARSRATARDVHMIAFSVVGLWVLVEAVPGLTYYIAELFIVRADPSSSNYFGSVMRSVGGGLMQNILRIIIGLWLLFGASGLVDLLRRARNFGLEEHEQPGHVQRDDSPAS